MIVRCPDVRQVSCPADDTRRVHVVCVSLLLSCRNCSLRLLCYSSADYTVRAAFIIVCIVLIMVLVALVCLVIAKCNGQCPALALAPSLNTIAPLVRRLLYKSQSRCSLRHGYAGIRPDLTRPDPIQNLSVGLYSLLTYAGTRSWTHAPTLTTPTDTDKVTINQKLLIRS